MFFDMFFTEEKQTTGLSKFNVYKLFMAMLQFFGSPSEQAQAYSSPKTRERSCEWTQVFRNIDLNHDGVVSLDDDLRDDGRLPVLGLAASAVAAGDDAMK